MLDSFEATLGERIRYYRKRKGMTQKQLADLCQITEPAIRNYELDNRIPGYDTLLNRISLLFPEQCTYYSAWSMLMG